MPWQSNIMHHEPLTTGMPADQAATKKKKRSKKGEKPERTEPQDEMQLDKKEKKRRKRQREDEVVEQEGEDDEKLDTEKRKKKKRKSSSTGTEQAAANAQEGEWITEKIHTKRKEKVRSESEERHSEPEETERMVRKQKKKYSKGENHGEIDHAADEMRKKRRTHKTSAHGFKDPAADESLSEQTCKALIYAYVQVDDPSNWKFNKARQNWLIRNIWSDEAIPSGYAPLVIQYLARVQGGAREALVQSCQTALAEPDCSNDPESIVQSNSQTGDGNDSTQTSGAIEIKRERARELLEILAMNIAA